MGEPSPTALDTPTESDIVELMNWFPDELSVRNWGSQYFRYPFTRETFFEDVRWQQMPTCCLRDSAGTMSAFGQFYERFGRANFARLAVSPAARGRGVGRQFVRLLLQAASERLPLDEAGLFVYRDNAVAIRCYEAAGFAMAEFPDGSRLQDECWS